MTGFDPAAAVSTAISSLTSTLTTVAPEALVVGAGVLGLTFAWRLVRKFVK